MVTKQRILCVTFCLLLLALSQAHSHSNLLKTYEEVFAKLPGWNLEAATIQPFGNGCTNQNYKLEVADKAYFVRVKSPPKDLLGLSLEHEIAMIDLATKLQLCPPIVLADPGKGIIIFTFIEGSTVNLRDKDKLRQTIQWLKTLHASKEIVPFLATPETFITDYLEILKALDIELTPHQKELIAMRPQPTIDKLVPCHMDLKGENILDDGDRLWLIDWEYGGMSDPLMDLGQLAPSEGFNSEELLVALSLYDKDATLSTEERLNQFKILSNIRIALWCLIMSRISTHNHPYQQWADELFQDIGNSLNHNY